MKRLTYIFASIALVCSCSQIESGTETVGAGYTTFFVSLENNPASRVSIESDASVKWSYGDSIAVFSDELPAPVIFKKNATEAKFTGSPVNGTVFCGYFPPEKDAFTKEAPHQLSFDSPAPVFNGNSSRAPMVAVSDDNHLFFRQTCGMLHFFIQSDTDYDLFAFFGNNEEMIAGRGTVNLDDELPEFSLLPEGRNIISSFIPGTASFVNGFHLYILLPPMRLEKGFTLVFYKMNEDGSDVDAVCPVTSEKALQIDRGQSVRMKDIKLGTDQPEPRLDIVKPDYMYRTGPHADLIDLTKLGISGTFNGIPLNIRYSTTNSWITLLGEGQAALIQGNTFTYPRTGNIRIQYCFGQIPIHQEFYNISQSSFNYKLEFTPNQEDFPYWRNFDTGGEKVLFFTPYEDTHSVVLRMSDPGLYYYLQPQTDIDTAEDQYIYADDKEIPAILPEATGSGGTGYDYNYKLNFTYSANRNYVEELVTYDMDDIVYRGLNRLCRVTLYPQINCFNLETWTEYQDYQYDADGNPIYSTLYLLQVPVIMYNQNDWWHTVWPMEGSQTEYSDYNPMVTYNVDEEEYYDPGDLIFSNMEWDISDIHSDNAAWPCFFDPGNRYGTPTGGNVIASEVYPYAASYVDYSDQYRPSSGTPDRSAGVYVNIDMKDGKDPIRWPVFSAYQPGIPVIRFTKFTWNGYWQDINEVKEGHTYTKATRGYFYVSVSDVGKYVFQRCGTDHINGSFIWDEWETLGYLGKGYNSRLITDGGTSFTGYQDLRMKYPNDTYVYAVNGPWYYSTSGAPIEPNPIPAATPVQRKQDNSKKMLEKSMPKALLALPAPVLKEGIRIQ